MDRSLGAERTEVHPAYTSHRVRQAADGSRVGVKFKTDAAGLKLALGSELLSTVTAGCTKANPTVRLFRHACRGSSQAANGSSGTKGTPLGYHRDSRDRQAASAEAPFPAARRGSRAAP